MALIDLIPRLRAPDRYAVMRFGPENNLYIFDHQHCSFITDEDGKMLVRKYEDGSEVNNLARSLNIKDREEKARKKEEAEAKGK